MIAPGMSFGAVSGRVQVTLGAALVADLINQGVGFMNDGRLALDSDPPSGDNWKQGVRLNNSGSVYVTTTLDPTDQWVEGLRISALGQLVIESADPTAFVNGNPLTVNGVFATS